MQLNSHDNRPYIGYIKLQTIQHPTMSHLKLTPDEHDHQKYVPRAVNDDDSPETGNHHVPRMAGSRHGIFGVGDAFRKQVQDSSLQGLWKITSPQFHAIRRSVYVVATSELVWLSSVETCS